MDVVASPALRPALALAWAEARRAVQAVPPEPVPAPLRPLVRFARLPERALDTVRAAVDRDDAFRLRVASRADEATLGRLAWVWLNRPEGWEAELAEAAARAAASETAAGAAREERVASRRLPVLEARIAALDEALEEARRKVDRAAEEVVVERAGRRRAEAELAGLVRMAEEATRTAEDAERRAAAAIASLEEARAEAGAAAGQVTALHNREAVVRGELEATRAELESVRATLAQRDRDERIRGSALAGAVADAGAAAARLGDALAEAAALLGPRAPGVGPVPARPDPPVPRSVASAPNPGADPPAARGAGAGLRPHPRPGTAVRRGGPRRTPVPLPGGMWDDSVDAALHLLRTRGAVVLVDGYNVTLSFWAGSGLMEQRHRLVSALGETALRTGVSVEVVFDGADDGLRVVSGPGGRAPVRVVFSPAGVDADDVIIERAVRLPPGCPVVVASDDRRVRDAVRAVGANLIGTRQLLEALGRTAGPRR